MGDFQEGMNAFLMEVSDEELPFVKRVIARMKDCSDRVVSEYGVMIEGMLEERGEYEPE